MLEAMALGAARREREHRIGAVELLESAANGVRRGALARHFLPFSEGRGSLLAATAQRIALVLSRLL
jgi:hypothetical protein